MMSKQMNKNTIEKISECKTFFNNLKENEPELINIDINVNEIRTNMTKWLVFLCDSLNFNLQTLLRTVIILDKFISVSDLFNTKETTQEKLNLITIACLSLATKMEEINCNYVSFFTEKVLNMPNCQIFNVKDLTKMEMNILKELKFNTLYSTAVDFMGVYLELFKNAFLANPQFLQNIKIITENLIKENITNKNFVTMQQSDFAFSCFCQALVQFGINQNFVASEFEVFLSNFNGDMFLTKNKVDDMINDSNIKYKKINVLVSSITTL